jgi:16S rRNA processing protein RimM
VGRVVKPHGVRGDVIVELVTDRTERLDPGSVLMTANGEVCVQRAARQGTGSGRWIVKFSGVDDRTAAEALRTQVLSAPALNVPGTLWVHELIGREVIDSGGAYLGTVASVEANPASDLLVLDSGGLVPLRFFVGYAEGRIVVDIPPGLLD